MAAIVVLGLSQQQLTVSADICCRRYATFISENLTRSQQLMVYPSDWWWWWWSWWGKGGGVRHGLCDKEGGWVLSYSVFIKVVTLLIR